MIEKLVPPHPNPFPEGERESHRVCLDSHKGPRFPRLLVACALLIALDAGLGLAAAQPVTTERLAVAPTPSDLRSLTEAVGGTRVNVTSLVPPGLDAEEYQPRPQDLARVAQARMIVRVGLDFDVWLDRLLVKAGARRGE